MRRQAIAFSAGWAVAWFVYKVLTVNPLWFFRNASAPASVPEAMLAEARIKGWL